MSEQVLTFDPIGHKYYYNGIEVPSVTTILSSAGLSDFSMVSKEILEAARELGTNVHKICELYDSNNLDEESLDDGGRSYLEAWKSFRSDYGIESFIASEIPMYSPKYKFAGRADRFAKLKKNRGQQVTCIDIKTGGRSKQTGPQLSGYAQMWVELQKAKGLHVDRIEVILEPSKYRVIEHRDPRDWNIFLSALNIFNYRKGV